MTCMGDIRYKSGDVEDSRKLVAFLYTLMRDYVTPGTVAEILTEKMNTESNMFGGNKEYQFSNGWLAEFAKYIADELTNTEGEPCGD